MMKLGLQILLSLLLCDVAFAVRLKDVANLRGVRDNQLTGYGLVVGLKGTGDSKMEFTGKSVKRMLDKMGMKVAGEEISSQNVAAVIVTATLPPFARAGNKIDIQVSSLGDAGSLKGGTLLQTPLRAADKNVYAVAAGPLLVSGTHTTVASLPNGGMVEKDMDAEFAHRKMYRYTLNNPDLTTAARIAKTINMDLGGKYATAIDPATVDLIVPFTWEGKGVELLSVIESLQVFPDIKAKVVVNEKTGTVVMGENVQIAKVAFSHGDLTVTIGGSQNSRRGPAALNAPPPKIEKVHMIEGAQDTVSVGELVQSLNRMGVSPKDLIVILQNIKASGALQGDLEIL
ncbi:MAG: flagellar basal body P-ring protein FlgI [Bdellovibrionales bacterium]|nr:flagellar basal body P-ring protein FlgI [Bdellovibrionales bacterium]